MGSSLIDDLEKLGALKEKGLITDGGGCETSWSMMQHHTKIDT